MADVEPSKTTGKPNRLKTGGGKRHGSADPKTKSRLTALAPGENLKERQVGLVAFNIFNSLFVVDLAYVRMFLF